MQCCLTSMAAMKTKAWGCSDASATKPGPGHMPPSPVTNGDAAASTTFEHAGQRAQALHSYQG